MFVQQQTFNLSNIIFTSEKYNF